MSEEECKAFVVQAVSHAMARDGSSGGNIRTVVINKGGIKRSFLNGTKVDLHLTSTPFSGSEIILGVRFFLFQAGISAYPCYQITCTSIHKQSRQHCDAK